MRFSSHTAIVATVVALCLGTTLDTATAQSTVTSPATFPNTPAAGLGRGLLDVVNSGDSARLQRWIDTSFVAKARAEVGPDITSFFRAIQQSSAGLELVRASGNEWLLMDVRVRRSGRLARIGLGMEPGTERNPQISGWHAYALPPREAQVVNWPTGRLSNTQIVDAIDARLSRLSELDEFSGVVRILRHDSLLFEQAYGIANRERGIPNTTETRFHTGSIGKMFTAVAVAQLIEEGKLRLDDTLSTVLPNYPNRNVGSRITIRHLLSHTSGLGAEPPGANSTLAAYEREAPAFTPGERYRYSNAGFALLAAVVEHISNEPFPVYLKKRVFEPAGMMRTGPTGDLSTDPWAVGYGWMRNDPLGVFARTASGVNGGGVGGGAGGHYLTAESLTRFSFALRAGKLVSRDMLRTLTTQQTPGANYGLGFGLDPIRTPTSTRQAIGHGGGGANSGIDNSVQWFADGEWTVAIVGNYDAPAVQRAMGQILALLAAQ